MSEQKQNCQKVTVSRKMSEEQTETTVLPLSKKQKKLSGPRLSPPQDCTTNLQPQLQCSQDFPHIDQLEKVRTFCVPATAAALLKSLCEQVPEALPNYTLWDKDNRFIFNVAKALQNKDHLELLWPILEKLLGDNIKNTRWTAMVACLFTATQVIANLALEENLLYYSEKMSKIAAHSIGREHGVIEAESSEASIITTDIERNEDAAQEGKN